MCRFKARPPQPREPWPSLAFTLLYAPSRQQPIMLDPLVPRVHDLLGLIQRHVELIVTTSSPAQLRDWLVVSLDLLARLQATQVDHPEFLVVLKETQVLEAEIVNAVLALHRHNFHSNVATVSYVQ
ncbi:hypothetical protein H310_03181 [Aphanomyces invadans]|uniref:Uncharacterized protein n=1 Tax=Aphanomyces invadans TaxID=157072 RepID=A0A024UGX5_9STRA|nr:hypothetical protein H310_03181 [Aphanomyces invadans]ETW05415.1 hypothetical protein H310_03181 [Aphanomyces invadans]|eukprot:XP_008865192.1 hypothetical protein H310_03181 [Aphanomyces invadans]